MSNNLGSLQNTTFLLITFTTELLEENISFNKEEILDIKWFSKEELKNMTSENLRDEKLIKRTLEMLEENRKYSLDVIELL